MNTEENKIDALIAKMDKLTEKEEGGLLGGVSSFQLIKDTPVEDTNYLCGANIYQCGKNIEPLNLNPH
jgi:hypothetical protein